MKTFRSSVTRRLSAMQGRRKLLTATIAGGAIALLVSGDALAQTTTTYDLAPAASGVTSQITAVLTVVLPIAGGIVALFLGWKMLKRFVAA